MSSSYRMTPQNVSKDQKTRQKKAVMSEETDFLEIDKPIPGQSFVCMSFLSPEAAIKERYLWYLKEFLNNLVTPIPQPKGMPELEYKTKLHTIIMKKISERGITNLWDDFLYEKNNELDSKYNDDVDFQTSTRGIKIRGTYSTYGEAKRRSTTISKFDKNHHVYIGQVGYWLPWNPDPHEVPDQEYQQKELNVLMKKYRENLISKDQFFHERNREKMETALKKNKNVKKIKEEDKKTLSKVRNTIAEKNKILAEVESKKETKKEVLDEKVSTEISGINKVTKETVSSVFEKEDPWMQRKMLEKN